MKVKLKQNIEYQVALDALQKSVKPQQPTYSKEFLEAQSPSTRKILERPVEEDEKWRARPLIVEGTHTTLGLKDSPEKIAEIIKPRNFTPEEVALEVDVRLKRGARIQGRTPAKSSVSPEKKERAVAAFAYSPGAELSEEEKAHIIEVAGYDPFKSAPPEPQKELKEPGAFKKGWDKFWNKVSGGAFYKNASVEYDPDYVHPSYSYIQLQEMRIWEEYQRTKDSEKFLKETIQFQKLKRMLGIK